MNTVSEPSLSYAPIWRRIAAAVYDGLLLLALWLSGTLLIVVAEDLMPRTQASAWERFICLYCFLIGFLFFGWCWTRGGRTPGLVAWRLQLQRNSGHPIRWPVAAIRYAAMLIVWSISLMPILATVPVLRVHFPSLAVLGWISLALLMLALLWTGLDRQRRSPQDRVASTVTLAVPKV